MTATSTIAPALHAPVLRGQTVVVIGGSAGIGLEATTTAAFDAIDFERLGRFFDELPTPIDHVLVTGPGPYYAPLAALDFARVHRDVDAHLLLPLQVEDGADQYAALVTSWWAGGYAQVGFERRSS